MTPLTMQPFVFSRGLATGDPVVDAQHRTLFAIGNQVLFAGDVREDPLLFRRGGEFLARYVRHHFAAEESAMERCGYPDLVEHREHHRVLTVRVEWIRDQASSVGQTGGLREVLYTLLNEWLRYHVQVLDRHFVQFLASRHVEDSGELSGVAAGIDAVTASEEDVADRIRQFW